MGDHSTHGEIGDLVEVGRERVGDPRRIGEILEVLGPPGHEHYRVRWEDGHETLFYPSGHASVVRHRERAKGKPALTRKS